jgi:hypothetical protein
VRSREIRVSKHRDLGRFNEPECLVVICKSITSGGKSLHVLRVGVVHRVDEFLSARLKPQQDGFLVLYVYMHLPTVNPFL